MSKSIAKHAKTSDKSVTPAGPPSEPTLHGTEGAWAAVGILAVIGLLTWLTGLGGKFVFDDIPGVENNLTIRHLLPLSGPLNPPANTTLDGRPVANLSFALSYALGGERSRIRVHHVVNILIHILAALTLFGIVRRTLAGPRLGQSFAPHAVYLAIAVAMIWMVHPLQTESVTYIVQRAESLMGLFYLLTLYCVIRAAASARPAGWYIAAFAACALGMGSKEVMVTAPLLVLLYDRIFLAGSFRNALAKRWPLYLGLAATWTVLGYLLWHTMGQGRSATQGADIRWWQYGLTEPGVILHYLRLAFWPDPLCLDYTWRLASSPSEYIGPTLAVGGLLAATAILLWRRPTAGFLCAVFFVILAPTSSFFPILDLAFEHRMYLPLAAVVALVVIGGFAIGRAILRRLAGIASLNTAGWILAAVPIMAAIAALEIRTFNQNLLYTNEAALYRQTVDSSPNNPRARFNFACALDRDSNIPKPLIIQETERVVALDPNYVDAHNMLGLLLKIQAREDKARGNLELAQSEAEEAMEHFRAALAIAPGLPRVLWNYGNALLDQGKPQEAVESYRTALEAWKDNARLAKKDKAQLEMALGTTLVRMGHTAEGVEHCCLAVQLDPNNAQLEMILGATLVHVGHVDEGVEHHRRAVQLEPNDPGVHVQLAEILIDANQLPEAFKEYCIADGNRTIPGMNHWRFAILLAHKNADPAAVMEHLKETFRDRPPGPQAGQQFVKAAGTADPARTNYLFAAAMIGLGRNHEAIPYFRQALAARPQWPEVANDLAWLLATDNAADPNQIQEAIGLAQEAADQTHRKNPKVLDTLAAALAAAGQFDQALQTAQEALDLAHASADPLAGDIQSHLALYRRGKPVPTSGPAPTAAEATQPATSP